MIIRTMIRMVTKTTIGVMMMRRKEWGVNEKRHNGSIDSGTAM
jgi:hypothetical protein